MNGNEGIPVFRTIEELTEWRKRQEAENRSVGFVPTMGYLHEGHAELIRQAAERYETVVVSVFVNPTQFGPAEDFDAYPKDLASDRDIACRAGAAAVFAPSAGDIYPQDGGIRIHPGPLADRLCGASRPGHFDGVLQVVLKLTNLVRPAGIFFGMKDAQQLALVETFFRDYNVPAEIHRVPTVREADGLAKSSRNVNLTRSERQEAPAIHAALQYGRSLYEQGADPEEAARLTADRLSEEITGTVDYVTMLSYPGLSPAAADDPEMILACAVKYSKARLIDNLIMKKEG